MEALRSADEIREVNTRYHDVAAESYDSKWGIDFGDIGQQQVLGKLRKLLGSELDDGYERSLEIGAGTGYFSLNLLQAGVVGEATCTDISPGMVARWAATPSGLGLEVRAARADAESLPFADASFDLVLGHAVLHHLPNLRRAFAEFHRVLRPGGRIVFAGEPSRVGDRIASLPKRGANALAPAWRRLMRQPGPRLTGRPARRGLTGRERRPRPGALRRHPRLRPRRPDAPRQARGVHRGQGARRGAGGQLVRLVQPRARGQRRPRRRADALAPVRLPRLPDAAAAGRAAARAAAAAGDLLQPAAGPPPEA